MAYGSGVMVEEGTGARLPFEARADWRSIRHDNTILVSSMAYPLPLHAQLGTFDAARRTIEHFLIKAVAHPRFTLRIQVMPILGLDITGAIDQNLSR